MTYTNLDPGTYVFRVTGSNGNGVWNETGRAITLVITPPWWATWWFRILAIVFMVGIGTTLYLQRVSSIKAQRRRLEIQVADRTSELSDRTDALERLNAQLIEQISERERAETGLLHSHQALATLLSASQQLASATDVELLPDRILDQLATVVSYNAAAVGTLDGDTLTIRAWRGLALDRQGRSFDVASIPPMPALIATRMPIRIADVQSEASSPALIESVFGELLPRRSWMGVPLVATDQVIGVLSIFHNQADFFSPSDQQRVQIFANLAAVAIENARLSEIALASAVLEERSRIARDLHDAVSQTLFSASLIAEGLRDARNLSPARKRQGLEDLRTLTRGALAEMRALLYELHPGGLTDKPLGRLLDSLCTAFTSRTRIPVALSVAGEDQAAAAGSGDALPHRSGGAEQHQQVCGGECGTDCADMQPGAGRARDRRRWARVRGGQERAQFPRHRDHARARGEDRRPADDRKPARRRHHDNGHLVRARSLARRLLRHGVRHGPLSGGAGAAKPPPQILLFRALAEPQLCQSAKNR